MRNSNSASVTPSTTLAKSTPMFALMAALTGLSLLVLGLWARQRGQASLSWPQTPGLITASGIDDPDGENLRPDIRYSYSVAGQRHEGRRIAYSGYGNSRHALEQLIARYPLNAEVPVFYDPAQPARAVLENRRSSDWGLWAGSGLAFLALALWLSRLV